MDSCLPPHCLLGPRKQSPHGTCKCLSNGLTLALLSRDSTPTGKAALRPPDKGPWEKVFVAKPC